MYQVRGCAGEPISTHFGSSPSCFFGSIFVSANAKPNILVILGPCTSRMEALPLGRAAEGATPAPGPSSEDSLAFEAASEPLSEQAPTLAPDPPASTSAQAMTPGEVLAAAAASTPVSPVSPLKRHGYNEIFGGAVPLMLARRAHRKHRPPLSPNSRATLERGWNSAPFSPTPPTLQGVKLARKEPWHDDAAHFVELLKMQDPPSLNNTRQARFWQSTARDVWSEESWSHMERQRVQARKPVHEQQRPWDDSVWHAQPFSLRGCKPVTKDAWWYEDQKIRRRHEPDRLRSERIKKGMPSPYEVQTREAEAKITPRFGWFSSAPAAAPAAAPAEAPAEPPAAAPRDASAPRPAAMPPSGRRDASPPTARPPESAEPAKAIADVAAHGSGGGGLFSWFRGHPSSQSEKAADELARRLTC